MLKEKAIYTVIYYDFSEHIAETHLFSSKTKAKEAVSKIINGYDEVHNSDDNDTSYFWYEHITQNDWKFENEDSYGWISIRKNKALVDEDNSVYVLMTIRWDPEWTSPYDPIDDDLKVQLFNSSRKAKEVGNHVAQDFERKNIYDIKHGFGGEVAGLFKDGSLRGMVDVQKQQVM